MYPIVYFQLSKNPVSIFKTKSGYKIIIRKIPSTDIHIFSEIWIENVYWKKFFEIKNGGVVIDIGSHVGFSALWLHQFCKKGRMYCYEPNPENFHMLKKNIFENNLSNIFISQKVVSNTEYPKKLYQTNNDSTNTLYGSDLDSYTVQSITLEKIFTENNINNCNFLKMDCEGAEYEILLNLSEIIFKKIDKICLEYHNIVESDYNVNDIIVKLKKYNFDVEIFPTSKQYGILFAQKK